MSFSVSLGDFILVLDLALRIIAKCKTAPAQFHEADKAASSLHIILSSIEPEVRDAQSILNRHKPSIQFFDCLIANCEEPLQRLDRILESFKSLRTRNPKTWDRITFPRKLIDEIKQSLAQHTQNLDAFLSIIGVKGISRLQTDVSQVAISVQQASARVQSVEHKIQCVDSTLFGISKSQAVFMKGQTAILDAVEKVGAEIRSGRNPESILSDDVEHPQDNKATWKALRRALLSRGFTSDDIKTHQFAIIKRLEELVNSGQWDSRPPSRASSIETRLPLTMGAVTLYNEQPPDNVWQPLAKQLTVRGISEDSGENYMDVNHIPIINATTKQDGSHFPDYSTLCDLSGISQRSISQDTLYGKRSHQVGSSIGIPEHKARGLRFNSLARPDHNHHELRNWIYSDVYGTHLLAAAFTYEQGHFVILHTLGGTYIKIRFQLFCEADRQYITGLRTEKTYPWNVGTGGNIFSNQMHSLMYSEQYHVVGFDNSFDATEKLQKQMSKKEGAIDKMVGLIASLEVADEVMPGNFNQTEKYPESTLALCDDLDELRKPNIGNTRPRRRNPLIEQRPTIGDSVLLTFSGVARLLRCASGGFRSAPSRSE